MFKLSIIRAVCFLAPFFLFSELAIRVQAQTVTAADDGVTTFFGLTNGNVIVGYEFLTEDGNTIVERRNGKCIQRINVPKATVAILSPFGQLLGYGSANLNVQATVDCETHAYTYERLVVSSVGRVVDLAGQAYRMKVYAAIIDGTVKVTNISFDPI